jgi:hypothetical protein
MPVSQYRKLRAPNEIRLLRIHARYSPVGLCCEAIHVRLEDAPQFEAISYTWGNPTKLRRISIDGRQFAAAVSVHEILRQSAHSGEQELSGLTQYASIRKTMQRKTTKFS